MGTVSKNQKANRLSNYMEELAQDVLNELVSKNKDKFSESAIRDIKALALNRLWPMYTTTDSGKNYLRKVVQEDNIEKDIVREIRAAMDIVKSNPR